MDMLTDHSLNLKETEKMKYKKLIIHLRTELNVDMMVTVLPIISALGVVKKGTRIMICMSDDFLEERKLFLSQH